MAPVMDIRVLIAATAAWCHKGESLTLDPQKGVVTPAWLHINQKSPSDRFVLPHTLKGRCDDSEECFETEGGLVLLWLQLQIQKDVQLGYEDVLALPVTNPAAASALACPGAIARLPLRGMAGLTRCPSSTQQHVQIRPLFIFTTQGQWSSDLQPANLSADTEDWN